MGGVHTRVLQVLSTFKSENSLVSTKTIQEIEFDSNILTNGGSANADITPETERDNISFEIIGRDVPAVSIKAKNEIPVGRGLGSSAAAIVSGLIAGDKATGIGLSQDEILTLAAEMEGHADNVGPALLGGLQIVVSSNQEWVTSQVPIPKKISLIIFIPDKLVLTSEARSSLPEAVTLDDAKFNIGRASLFVNSMAQGDIDHLGIATQDRLHQDYRAALLPGINSVFISGSGPSVIAISEDRGMTVCYEMSESASKAGVHGEIRITQPSLYGASLQVINK